MTPRILAPALIGLLLATTAFASSDDKKVKDIDVSIDLTAVTNPAAALRFATTADDLKNAIAARVTERTDEDGVTINIDLSEVELSNSYTDMVGAADTRLVGNVKVTNGAKYLNEYELSVDINQAQAFFPATVDMTTLTASSDDFYASMIAAFADGVVRRLER